MTRRNLVLVKPLSTLKYSTQVNKFDEAVVITRTEEDEFVGCQEDNWFVKELPATSGKQETLVGCYHSYHSTKLARFVKVEAHTTQQQFIQLIEQ